mmetsp:Transcript_116310/g.340280  ORF Transcript_116310/g.340280 Transcript_116310/m.340280 type:complete len:212 (-) Transcript_116310:27-662(-)
MPQDTRPTEIKRRFKRLDLNRDGGLSQPEMCRLLRKGRPDLTDRELEILFDNVDKNGNGRIEFAEFVDYVFDQKKSQDRPHSRSSSSPRRRRQEWDHVAEETEISRKELRGPYEKYAGRNDTLEGSEFARMCRDCGLHDDRLGGHDVDTIFASVCPRGTRHISQKQFEEALEMIAHKKGCPTTAVRALIAASEGPVLVATKPEDVRFYPDS